MTTAEDIEKAVAQLSSRELARFRAWFEAFDAERFDAAIERDAQSGKLDALADEALAAHRAGRSRECRPTPVELAGIDRGLRAAAEGRFANEAKVEAIFSKFRGQCKIPRAMNVVYR